jgi:hypothetical protein
VKRPSIIGIALAAGVFAFVWTLHSQAPPTPARQPQYLGAGGPAHAGSARTARVQEVITGEPITLEQLEALAREDQHNWVVWQELAQRRMWAGQADAQNAWQQVVKIHELERSEARSGLMLAAAVAHRELGDEEHARELFERLRVFLLERARSDGLRLRQSWYRLGRACAYLADEAGAKYAWERASEIAAADPSGDPVARFDLACYRSLLGDQEGGLDALRGAASHGFADVTLAVNHEDLSLVRKHPGFAEIIARMNENVGRGRRGRTIH